MTTATLERSTTKAFIASPNTPRWQIDTSDLRTLLATVAPAVARKTVLPILTGVALIPDGELGVLEAWATNLHIGIVSRVPADVQAHGSVVVAHDLMSSLVGRLSGKATCAVERLALAVEAGSATAKVRTVGEPDDMPVRPHIGEFALTLIASDLSRAIGRSAFAMATNDNRPALFGLHAIVRGGEMIFEAADGFRAAIVGVGPVLPETRWPASGMIVPSEAVRALDALLGSLPAGATVSLHYDGDAPGALAVVAESWTFFARLIEATFPDMKNAFLRETVTTVEVDAPSLGQAVKLATIFGQTFDNDARHPNIVLAVGSDAVTISGTDASKGEVRQTLTASVTGPPIEEIVFNGGYLADAIAAVGRPVSIAINGPGQAVVFRDTVGSDTWIVMSLTSKKGF